MDIWLEPLQVEKYYLLDFYIVKNITAIYLLLDISSRPQTNALGFNIHALWKRIYFVEMINIQLKLTFVTCWSII